MALFPSSSLEVSPHLIVNTSSNPQTHLVDSLHSMTLGQILRTIFSFCCLENDENLNTRISLYPFIKGCNINGRLAGPSGLLFFSLILLGVSDFRESV